MKDPNLVGGLPFPAPSGRRQPARPLRVSKRALTVAQARNESRHQMDFIAWVRRWSRQYPEIALPFTFHAPNEGELAGGHAEARKRYAMGVSAGVVDVVCVRPRRGHHVFVAELKVRDNDVTPEQDLFLRGVAADGGFAHTFWAWPELARAFAWYFGIADRMVVLSYGVASDYLLPRLGGHDGRCFCGKTLDELLT